MSTNEFSYKKTRHQRWKYRLLEPYNVRILIFGLNISVEPYVSLNSKGVLKLSEGYAWDGATCAFDTRDIMRASLVHDALYQFMRMSLMKQSYRIMADDELRRICIEDGMNKFVAFLVWSAVRAFGAGAAKNS